MGLTRAGRGYRTTACRGEFKADRTGFSPARSPEILDYEPGIKFVALVPSRRDRRPPVQGNRFFQSWAGIIRHGHETVAAPSNVLAFEEVFSSGDEVGTPVITH